MSAAPARVVAIASSAISSGEYGICGFPRIALPLIAASIITVRFAMERIIGGSPETARVDGRRRLPSSRDPVVGHLPDVPDSPLRPARSITLFALCSSGRRCEQEQVAVGIPDGEGGGAPGLAMERLGEIDTCRPEFLEQAFQFIGGFERYRRRQQALALAPCRVDHLRIDVAQVNPGAVPDYLRVVRRVAIGETDREAQYAREEIAGGPEVRHKRLGLGAREHRSGQGGVQQWRHRITPRR